MYIKQILVRHARPGVNFAIASRLSLVTRLQTTRLLPCMPLEANRCPCAISYLLTSHFAVAELVWTRRVDDQEKPDFLTGLPDSRSRSENFTYLVSMRRFCHVPVHVLVILLSQRERAVKKYFIEIISVS